MEGMEMRKRGGRAGSLTAEDWVRAALRALAKGGVGAVAVEPLAQQLGVTKGSFYWHFPTRDALLSAALEHWEKESTEAVIVAVDTIADPRDRLMRLGAAVGGGGGGGGAGRPPAPAATRATGSGLGAPRWSGARPTTGPQGTRFRLVTASTWRLLTPPTIPSFGQSYNG